MLSLASLRQTPQPGPERFLRNHPGCWVQYYDDTGEKNPWKALSARSFDPEVARAKQMDRCAVAFSLQAFGASRTKEGLLCYRNMGVDVDLVAADERQSIAEEEIDRRKDEYLQQRLSPFPLRPHWLTETRHGLHVIFRVQPMRDASAVSEAEVLNRRLVRALSGDENAALLTQVLRVPGTLQFKGPRPFLCRLLVDNSAAVPPYPLGAVRSFLDVWEAHHGTAETALLPLSPKAAPESRQERAAGWREGLGGVAEGGRNALAASLAGAILGRLPEELWETAGWGGLKEWNARNAPPLPERELRSVFGSIARRERTKRQRKRGPAAGALVRVEVLVGGEGAAAAEKAEADGADRGISSPRPPC
jgi:hypothetical protein